MITSFEDFETQDDPFAYASAGKFLKTKTKVREQKIPFNVINAEETVNQFDGKPQFVLSVEYIDPDTETLVTGDFGFSVTNAAGKESRRATAIRSMIEGLKKGKRYDNLYLVGSGPAMAIASKPWS